MQKILNMDKSKTILKIACDEKIIDTEVYERLSGIKYDDSKLTEVRINYKPREKKKIDDSILSMWTEVYECMRDFFGLSYEHRQILENDRCISRERIDQDYFSIDTATNEEIS